VCSAVIFDRFDFSRAVTTRKQDPSRSVDPNISPSELVSVNTVLFPSSSNTTPGTKVAGQRTDSDLVRVAGRKNDQVSSRRLPAPARFLESDPEPSRGAASAGFRNQLRMAFAVRRRCAERDPFVTVASPGLIDSWPVRREVRQRDDGDQSLRNR
jgi:hypothetical protein